MKRNRKITTCNRLDLETLGFRTNHVPNLSGHFLNEILQLLSSTTTKATMIGASVLTLLWHAKDINRPQRLIMVIMIWRLCFKFLRGNPRAIGRASIPWDSHMQIFLWGLHWIGFMAGPPPRDHLNQRSPTQMQTRWDWYKDVWR